MLTFVGHTDTMQNAMMSPRSCLLMHTCQRKCNDAFCNDAFCITSQAATDTTVVIAQSIVYSYTGREY